MIYDFAIKQGDFKPDLAQQLLAGGVAQDLTGVTDVTFSMWSATTGKPKVSAAAAVVTDAPNGKVKYTFQGTDTDTPDAYLAQFRVNFGSGSFMSFPSDGYLTVVVEPRAS